MPYIAQTGYIGIGRQTSSGNYVTPQVYLYVDSASIEPATELLIPDPEIGTGRSITDDVYVGPIHWAGEISYKLRPESAGFLMLGAHGAVTSSGIAGQSGAYGHTFTLEDQLVPLSIEKAVSNTLENFGYTDSKVNTFRIEATAGELAISSASIIAISETSGKTVQTPTFETGPIFTFSGGTATLEGTPVSVKGFSYEVNNNIVDDDYRLGSRTLGSLREKRRELTVTLDIVPESSSFYKKTVYGSGTATTVSGGQTTYAGSVLLHLESANGVYAPGTTTKYSLDINIPNAIFRNANIPNSGDDLIIETLELVPTQASQKEATLALRNAKANYNAA